MTSLFYDPKNEKFCWGLMKYLSLWTDDYGKRNKSLCQEEDAYGCEASIVRFLRRWWREWVLGRRKRDGGDRGGCGGEGRYGG